MFKSILVPVNGTPLSYILVETAAELAKMSQGKLFLLSVAEPRMFNSFETDALEDAEAAEAINIQAAKETIQKAIDSVKKKNVPLESVISLSGSACDAIMETAHSLKCDIILMATRGEWE